MFYLKAQDNFYWQSTARPTKGLDLITSLLEHFISIAMVTSACLCGNALFNQMLPFFFSRSPNCIVKFTTSPGESDNAAYGLACLASTHTYK